MDDMILSKQFEEPKEQSQAVNQKRTDNTMAKWKRTNNDLQNITQKTKDRATGKPGVNSCAPEV